jgi:signal transduction histidine kinase
MMCLSSSQLLKLFERAPNAILVVGPDGRIVQANLAAARMFGRDSLEARDARLQQLFDPEETFEPKVCLAELASGPVVRAMSFLDQSASAFEARVTILATGPPADELLALHFHDLVIGESIEDALFVLNEDLVSLNEALVERNADLERFAAIAAHDLQEPLRKIAIFSDLLGSTQADRLDDAGRHRLGIINASARQMRTLVDGLLLYARSSGRRLKVEDAPLDLIVSDACEAVRAMIEETGATIAMESLPMAHVDHALMVHVMQNLLTNAIKYRRDEPPRITVTAEAVEDAVIVKVADNGQGFDMKHHDRIFQSFTRLHRKDEIAGVGLGLALAKRIVERHGGRIWAESEPGRGSSFFVRVGRGREQSRAA